MGVVPFELFDPVVTCPPPSKLMRLDPGGPVEKPTRWVDGAKWMCVPFPRTARPGCVVLSFGSNDQFEFEQAALDMTPCTVHTFDCTAGMLGNATRFESIDPARHAFHPYCVGSQEMVAANPKQMLNWEGLLRLVKPLGAVTVRESPTGQGRQLREDQFHTDANTAGRDDAGTGRNDEDAPEEEMPLGTRGVGCPGGSSRRLQRMGFWGGAGRRPRRRDASSPEVFILKIDVEGFEWQLLAEWGPHTPGLPAFIAIEIHNWVESYKLLPPAPPAPPPPAPPAPPGSGLVWWLWGKRASERRARAATAAARAAQRAALLEQWSRRQRVLVGELSLMFLHLARLGYAVVAREDNPNGDINARLCCAEFLFIRVRGPEEGRPGMWDWTHWFSSFRDGLAQGR